MIAFLYDLIYVIPLSLFFIIPFDSYMPLSLEGPARYAVILFFAVLIPSIIHVRQKYKFFLVGIPVVFAVTFVIILAPGRRSLFFKENAGLPFIILIIILAFILSRLLMRFEYLRLLMFFSILSLGAYKLYLQKEVHPYPVVLGICIALIILVEEVQLRWKKSGYTKRPSHLVNIAPFLLIAMLGMSLAPKPEDPYDWQFFINVYTQIKEEASRIISILFYNEEEYSSIGFSDDAVFIGQLSSETDPVFEIATSKDSGTSLYLSGIVYDTFDGRQWTSSDTISGPFRLYDSLQTYSAIQMYDDENQRDYIRTSEVNVRYRMKNTRYIFTPMKVIMPEGRIEPFEYSETSESVTANKRINYNSQYSLSYVRLNKNTDEFRTFIKECPEIDRESWDRCLRDHRLIPTKDYSYDSFLNYKSQVHRLYESDIELSDRTTKFVDTLFEDADSDYQKMKRLEAVLRTYGYTTSPGPLPDTVEDEASFLDYFLWDSKEGYCSHFTTAFVLIARAEGLPARYVQGYCINDIKDYTKTIYSCDAHAWPEVYFDNVGWVSFEVTPGYEGAIGWPVGVSNYETESYYANYKDHIKDISIDETDSNILTKEEAFDSRLIIFPIIGIILLLAICIFISKAISSIIYNRLDDISKTRSIFRKNMRKLGYLGYKMLPGETLSEFSLRAQEEIPKEVLQFIAGYEEILYSDKSPDKDVLRLFEANGNELLALISGRRKFRYYLYLIFG